MCAAVLDEAAAAAHGAHVHARGLSVCDSGGGEGGGASYEGASEWSNTSHAPFVAPPAAQTPPSGPPPGAPDIQNRVSAAGIDLREVGHRH